MKYYNKHLVTLGTHAALSNVQVARMQRAQKLDATAALANESLATDLRRMFVEGGGDESSTILLGTIQSLISNPEDQTAYDRLKADLASIVSPELKKVVGALLEGTDSPQGMDKDAMAEVAQDLEAGLNDALQQLK